jgi:hypothetical protein
LAGRLLEATRAVADLPAASWVRGRFLRRFRQALPLWLDPWEVWLEHNGRMPERSLRDLEGLCELLGRLPEGPEVLRPYQEYLETLCDYTGERDPARHELIVKMLVRILKRGSRR